MLAILYLEKPGCHLGPPGKVLLCRAGASQQLNVELVRILQAEAALLHQDAGLTGGGEDHCGIGGPSTPKA